MRFILPSLYKASETLKVDIHFIYVTTFLFSLQVNIERDFNLKELKKAAEEKEKLKEKNTKKEKNKAD